MPNENNNEYIDLVDQFDNVIGCVPISEVHDLYYGQSRAVNIFIQNRNGEIWVPRRQKNKTRWPGSLDFSASGHVSTGESYEEAAIREIHEELGIDLCKTDLLLLEKITPNSHPWSPCFCSYYLVKYEQIDLLNYEDFIDGKWLYPKLVYEQLLSSDESKGKPALIPAIKYFFNL